MPTYVTASDRTLGILSLRQRFTKLWYFSCVFFSFQGWIPILSTQQCSVALLPRGRLVTQPLKKKELFHFFWDCSHSLEPWMQNKGVISVLPSSHGCVQLRLRMLLDKWSLFVRLLQHWALLKAHQGHLESSTSTSIPLGWERKQPISAVCETAERISFSGTTRRGGSFGAQP